MSSKIYIFAVMLLIASCVDKKQEQFKKDILGDWKEVRRIFKPNSDGFVIRLPHFPRSGLTFQKNNVYINKDGFIEYDKPISSYIGNKSTYRLEKGSLSLYNQSHKSWRTYNLDKLTPDSLILDENGDKIIYGRLKPSSNGKIKLDRIILSTSGCFGTCPVMSISIDHNGAILFQGSNYTTIKGLYAGVVDKNLFKKLNNDFQLLPLDSIDTNYKVDHSDDETITTTFVKNGHIVKTVADYGGAAPSEFTWAYVPFRYLYQNLNLREAKVPEMLKNYEITSGGIVRKGNVVLDIHKSEMFLLYDYLSKGKVTDVKFNPTYTLHGVYYLKTFKYGIKTDGRFYTIQKQNGTQVTIDAGVNFIKDIEKLRQWRAITEYDF